MHTSAMHSVHSYTIEHGRKTFKHICTWWYYLLGALIIHTGSYTNEKCRLLYQVQQTNVSVSSYGSAQTTGWGLSCTRGQEKRIIRSYYWAVASVNAQPAVAIMWWPPDSYPFSCDFFSSTLLTPYQYQVSLRCALNLGLGAVVHVQYFNI